MSRIAIVAIAVASFCGAQERREFDVASVKAGARDAPPSNGVARTPGGISAPNTPFWRLVEIAFQTNQIDWSRVPESFRSARFQIMAKAAGKIGGDDEYWAMLRALLEDRFALKHHTEMRETRVYAMIPAKKGGSPGPQLSASADPNCPVNPSGKDFCGVSHYGPGFMAGQRVPMARIARELSGVAGRPVQDRTGLTGAFDFQLKWMPDQDVAVAAADSALPSFFSAVQEELGLKLEPGQGRVETLVIDSAQSPSEN